MIEARFPGLRLIGLSGRKHVGKSTLADFLNVRGFAEVAFADPLKDGICVMLGISREEFEVYKDKPLPWLGVPMRGLMQKIGTEVMRGACQDVWLIRATQRIHDLYTDDAMDIVVSDIRFDNEAELVRSLGGTVVHVRRDTGPDSSEPDGHESEQGVVYNERDLLVLNNACLPSLGDAAAWLCNPLTVRHLDSRVGF